MALSDSPSIGLPGVRGSRASTTVREGVDFLVTLHTETAERTRISDDLFEQFAKPRIEAITRDARQLDPDFDLTPLANALFAALENREIPLVQTHGDDWPGNVLVTPQAELAAVLYWLERVSQWLVTDFHEGKRDDAWLRRNVLRTAPLLAAALRRASAAPPVG